MKRIILLVASIALFALSSLAADVKLGWDIPPVAWTSATTVRIYEITATSRTLVKEGPAMAKEITLTGVAPGTHTYVATAFEVWESDDSNTVTLPSIPAPPSNLKFSVTITMTIP